MRHLSILQRVLCVVIAAALAAMPIAGWASPSASQASQVAGDGPAKLSKDAPRITDAMASAACSVAQAGEADAFSAYSLGDTEKTYEDILAFAKKYIGKPYVWGGKKPSDGGFDCSGFVSYVYVNVCKAPIDGHYTPAAGLYDLCTPISKSKAKPGDLVFWRGTYGSLSKVSHVGIYCGGDITLNAASSGVGYSNINYFTNINGGKAAPFFGRLMNLGAKFSLASKDVKVSVGHQAHTGTAVTPKPTVTRNGAQLTEGKHYTLSYSDNIDPGTATVTLKGKGPCEGSSIKVTFEIHKPTLKNGYYQLRTSLMPSKCLQATGSVDAEGAGLELARLQSSDWQGFLVKKRGGGFYSIKNVASGKYLCIDSDPWTVSKGTNVAWGSWSGDDCQLWSIRSAGGGYVISPKHDGSLSVALPATDCELGTAVTLQERKDAAPEVWNATGYTTKRQKLDKLAKENASSLKDGTYRMRALLSSSYVLEVKDASTSSGAKVQLWKYCGTDNQLWTVSHDAKGYTMLQNAGTGMYLTAKSSTAKNGVQLVQRPTSTGYASKWVAVRDGSFYKMVSALDSSMVIDLSGNKAANGLKAQLLKSNNGRDQRFGFTKTKPKRERLNDLARANKGVLEDGTYRLGTSLGSNYVIEPKDKSPKVNAKAQLFKFNASKSQKWRITHDSKGYVIIRNARTDYCLGASKSGVPGAQLTLQKYRGAWTQKWIAVRSGSCFKLVSATDENQVIDLSGAKKQNRAKITLWTYNGGRNQLWKIARA